MNNLSDQMVLLFEGKHEGMEANSFSLVQVFRR